MHRPDLWIVRHGETEWSRDLRHTGRTDLPLTPRGADAARSLVVRLAEVRFDVVMSSPLQRAAETARLAGFPDAETVDDAREWDYGDYEGITTDEIRRSEPGWTVWSHGAKGGEDAAEVGLRADRVVERVRAEASERALLFAHGHLLRVLAARWLGLDASDGLHLRLDTATISVLSWERDDPALLRWNA